MSPTFSWLLPVLILSPENNFRNFKASRNFNQEIAEYLYYRFCSLFEWLAARNSCAYGSNDITQFIRYQPDLDLLPEEKRTWFMAKETANGDI